MSTIEIIVENYSDTVYRTALAYLHSTHEAEDAVEAVLEKYLSQRDPPDLSDPERLRAWLITVTANHCKDLLRSAAFRKRAELSDSHPARDGDSDLRLDVENALGKLPPKYRVPLYLYYFEGYDTAQIGRLLGLPKGTVVSRLKRARDRIRPLLADYGKEDSK